MSPRPARAAAVVLGALAIASAACDHDRPNPACFEPFVPGIVIQLPPIDVAVRNTAGRGIAPGSQVAVRRSPTDSIITAGTDTVHVRTGFAATGTYTVRVSKQYYRDTVVANVVVRGDECGGPQTTQLPVTLHLAPNAPPIRSLAVLGENFLWSKGQQVQLTGWLDADPGVPTTISWRSSDTTLAKFDSGSFLHAQCTTTGGAVTVTAVSTADTTVRGTETVGIGAQTSCP